MSPQWAAGPPQFLGHCAAVARGPGSAASLRAAPTPRPAPLSQSSWFSADQPPGPGDLRLCVVSLLSSAHVAGVWRWTEANRKDQDYFLVLILLSFALGAFPGQEKMRWKRWCACLSSGSGKQCAQGTVSAGCPVIFVHALDTRARAELSPPRPGPREVMSGPSPRESIGFRSAACAAALSLPPLQFP